MRHGELSRDAPVAATPSPRTTSDADSSALSALIELAARPESDPVLRLVVADAVSEFQSLRGVALAIASRYRSLLDSVPDAVTIHDETGRILEANAAACRIYGYERAALVGKSVRDLNPELPPGHMQSVLATFRLGQTVTIETSNRRGDGTTFPVEVHSSVYLDGGEKRVLAVARDVGRRYAADAELRASETRYRLLLQAMDKGVLVQDAEGKPVSVNPAGCRILGMAEGDLLQIRRESMQDWRFFDEHGGAMDIDDLPGFRALHSGKPVASVVYGVYLPHLDTVRWLSTAAVPQYHDGEATPFQVVSTFSDVTTLKRESELFAQTQLLGNIGGWELDLDQDRVLWTEHMYRIFDLPPGSAVDLERALAHFPPEECTRIRAAIEAGRRGQSTDLELRMTSAIGRRRWVRAVSRPLRHGERIYALSGTLQDITERKLVEDRLRHQALTDAVTSLPNRDAMLGLIETEIGLAAAGGGPTLLYLDIDRFKAVNDMLGHRSGDRLLAIVAERLRACLPTDARCARFGGDEFMVLLPAGTGEEAAGAAAEAIAAAMAQPFHHADEDFHLTISLGIARYPDDGAGVQQLVNHADAALTEAKRRGRNNWQRFTPALARRLSDRLRVEGQLRRALDNAEFHLDYQPQVELGSGRVVAAEALLRWHNRELGDLRPDLFIGHAENSGDIVAIGAWVIREACRQLREWRDGGLMLARIAVNVSYRQLLSETLAGTVIAALREFGLPGEALELEMTERVLIEDAPDTVQTFATLQGLGVMMTIDDFGEGYSALTYLRRLPIEGLKISHGFMQGVPGNAADSAICEAIIRIGQSLGLTVIAEGVETGEQREFLLGRGLAFAQGFLFSRPLAPAQLAEFVRRHSRPF